MAIASGAVYCHRKSSPGNNRPAGLILDDKIVKFHFTSQHEEPFLKHTWPQTKLSN